MFEIADIYETKICPLAKVMRRELKKRGIEKLKVVYSQEPAITPAESAEGGVPDIPGGANVPRKRRIPGSNSFVPPVAGLIIAGEVIKDITGYK